MRKIFKVLSLLMVAMMVLALVGCSSSGESPEKSVENFLGALKKADLNEAKLYLPSDERGNFEFDDENQEKMVKPLMGNIEYKVLSSKTKGDTATVKVSITVPDMSELLQKIMQDAIKKAMDAAAKGEELDQKKMEQEIMDQLAEGLKASDIKKTTSEVEVNLKKNKDKDKDEKSWIFEDSESLGKALTGGLEESIKQLQ